MNKEKQIEEMANIIHKGELDRNKGDLDCTEFTTDTVVKVGLQRLAGAKALYNAGYRKADEFAREIFEEIENALELLQRSVKEARKNDGIKYQQLHDGRILSIEAIEYFIDELKKKYTEKGE